MSTIEIDIPMPHDAQRRITEEAQRFNVLACGRRWGKTLLGAELAIRSSLEGHPVGWFAPTYKFLQQAWDELIELLQPMSRYMHVNKSERAIRMRGGGRIDMWTLERPNAGRGRKYARAIIDEAAMARNLEDDWTKSIRPTLTDLEGDAWFLSTPRGHNYFHQLWTKGQGGEPGWSSWQMPTRLNPHIPPEEIDAAESELPADAFSQEYLAEFLADASNPFGVAAIRACVAPCRPGPVAVLGIDLAKSHDWTVCIALDDSGRTVAFQRWQSDWRNTTARLAAMIKNTPALVDSTGVGDPIVEELQSKCPLVEGYRFTPQSKQQLMEGLAVAIQRREITFPEGVIRHELEQFQYEYTRTGVRYTAPEGCHDDCVDALALAVRNLVVKPQVASLAVLDVGDDEDDYRWFNEPYEDDRFWD